MTNSSPPPPTQRIPSSSQPSLPSVSMTASATPETTRADFQCGASLMRLPSALAENYTLIEHLPTKGAEADIFLVEHRPTGDKSIAKVYRRDIECKPDLLERLRGLDSRHVVQIIDHGKSDGHWFELMEYLPFGTLDVYLNRHTPHSEETRRAVLKELHDALRYLHTNGIFHRDLKPENILVREEDPLRLVFSDFGIASLSEASIRFTQGAGTLHYAAPEQIVAAATVTGKTDYWSLGMILFEMLAGRHPFSELGEYAIAAVIATGNTGNGGNLPFEMIADPKWRTLCQGLLVRDPQQRWGSEEVGRWLQGDETLEFITEYRKITYRPYIFNRQEYYTSEALAEALASDWNSAIKHLQRGYITSWFSKELMNQDLAILADELLENPTFSPDIRLHRLLLEMNHSIFPNWKGIELTKKNIHETTKKIIAGEIEENFFIKDLYENKMFIESISSNYYVDISWHNKIYYNWKNKIEDIENTLSSISKNDILKKIAPDKNTTISFLLLSCVDNNFVKKIKNEFLKLINEKGISEDFINIIFKQSNYEICKYYLTINGISSIEEHIKTDINDRLKYICMSIYNRHKYIISYDNFFNSKYENFKSITKKESISQLKEKFSELEKFDQKLTLAENEKYKSMIKNIIDNNKVLIEKLPEFKIKIFNLLDSANDYNWKYSDLLFQEIIKISKYSDYFNKFLIFMDKIIILTGKSSSHDYKSLLKIINDSMIDGRNEKLDQAMNRCESLKREWLTIGVM